MTALKQIPASLLILLMSQGALLWPPFLHDSCITNVTLSVLSCSLPSELQHRTKLLRQACMNIDLWKDYSTSTDAERDAHLRKFHLRFQKLKSGEINANASVALNRLRGKHLDALMFHIMQFAVFFLEHMLLAFVMLFLTLDLLSAALVPGDIW